MAKDTREFDERWGDWVVKRTFLFTVVLGGLFVGTVFLFIIL